MERTPGRGRSRRNGALMVGGAAERRLPPEEVEGGEDVLGVGDYYLRVGNNKDGDYLGTKRQGSYGAGSSDASSDLRLSVIRHLLFVVWYPRRPRYDEARPIHFPSQLDALLTGGLYAHLHQNAVSDYLVTYQKVHTVTFIALLVAFMVYFWDSPMLFDASDDTGVTTMSETRYWVGAFILYLFSNVVTYLITRPVAARRFHQRAADVVQKLSPVVRRAGFDIRYGPSYWLDDYYDSYPATTSGHFVSFFTKIVRCVMSVLDDESFVRFVPRRRYDVLLSDEERLEANELWDPTAHVTSQVPFRVAVLGRRSYSTSHGTELNFYSVQSYNDVQSKVDLFTWGAVATEMRNGTELYRQVRIAIVTVIVVISQVPMWLPETFYEVWWPTLLLMGLMMVFLIIILVPTPLETWILKYVFRRNIVDEMRSQLRLLSPLVESRAGYSLSLQVEPDGCLGGTVAYVNFEPTAVTSATVAPPSFA